MWEPRGFGIFIGWLGAAATAVYFLAGDMVKAGLFGEACREHGLESWSCGIVPKLVVAVPNSFVYFLALPFTYDGSADLIGTSYALMLLGSPVAYALALVAVNYWVWKLNQL